MAETRIQGVAASEGVAVGIFYLREEHGEDHKREAGSPLEEDALFMRATSEAARELRDLMFRVEKDAADILEFQVELLADEDFLKPVHEAIAAGKPSDAAWVDMVNNEIAAYRGGGDEHLAARADDLRDLRKRVFAHIHGVGGSDIPQASGLVLAAASLTPSEFLELDVSRLAGLAVRDGSPASHVSILARARGLPLIVGCHDGFSGLRNGSMAVIDCRSALLLHDPDAAVLAEYRKLRERLERKRTLALTRAMMPAITRTNEHVIVYANVDNPSILAGVDPDMFDGVGLTRTEFLFEDGNLPDEQQQFEVYAQIMRWAGGRPVTIRTLDAGGDKPVPGVTFDGESNPFMGIRGYRLSRLRKPLFMTQLRALARTALLGPLKVMVPMITAPFEMNEFREFFAEAVRSLEDEGMPCATPKLGMMIEVPSAAMGVGRFDADFYSVGSNDLVQYVTASARDSSFLSHLARPEDPAVLQLIGMIAAEAAFLKREVSVCGDMASTPRLIPHLLRCGIRAISVAISQSPDIKEEIRKWGAVSTRAEAANG
jgi:phosphotransferase system enzyme I (PtsI)